MTVLAMSGGGSVFFLGGGGGSALEKDGADHSCVKTLNAHCVSFLHRECLLCIVPILADIPDGLLDGEMGWGWQKLHPSELGKCARKAAQLGLQEAWAPEAF